MISPIMLNRIGYPCVSRLLNRSTNHTCRLNSAAPERLRALIEQNLADLEAILAHNLAHGWRLFRIGSSVIPFGSHPVNQLAWWEEHSETLSRIGEYTRQHDIRLSFHPGQFTVLNSPDSDVVSRAVDELIYSTHFLDTMGIDSSHKIVIHLGGVYGDKDAAMARSIKAINRLDPKVRARLVIENDERNYAPSEAIRVSNQTGVPVVFDNLHYRALPGEGKLEEILAVVFSTWGPEDGIPKVHFSSQAKNGRKGNHAEFADPTEYQEWISHWSIFGEFDLMLEAKAKDEALVALKLD
ncbi:MAG: UV DNA damage repair endonuclease UvsE [Anaerolineales bacterium]|nr:UV DNA damage repair endonuclease UvsE [Anaerolineales bacterium]